MRKHPFFLFCFFILSFISSGDSTEHILLFGPPGSGKGSLSQLAVKKGLFFHICPGDLIRKEINDQTPLGIEVKELVAQGEDLQEEMICAIVATKLEECLDQNKYFILDGFPRSFQTYDFLQTFLSKHHISCHQVIVVRLDSPDEILRERIKNRLVCPHCFHVYHKIHVPPIMEGFCDECHCPLERRLNDQQEVIEKRLRNYREKISPIEKKASLDFPSISLSTTEEIKHFVDQEVEKIE